MKKLLVITALSVCAAMNLNAQTVLVSSSSDKIPKNYIKLNLTSIALKNYSIQYERALTKTISIALAFRDMPTTNLPFKSQILKQVKSDDESAEKIINNLTMSNFAITPEVRFYLGKKGYGRGFYIAPFYRYAKYEIAKVMVDFEVQNNGVPEQRNVTLGGNVTANTGGLMFGAQWALARHISLDWWILGPHFGVSSGDLTGVPDQQMSSEDQAEVRDKLEDIDIPMIKKTVSVNSNSAAIIFDGPWAGIRAGISIGFRF